MTWRAELTRRSVRPLRFLAGLPRWMTIFLAVGVLLLGLGVPGPAGALALGVLALFLGWLLTLSWPTLLPAARLSRGLVVAALLAVAASRFR